MKRRNKVLVSALSLVVLAVLALLHGQGFATGGRVAAGMTSILWPTEQTTPKIVILGLGEPPQ